MRFHSLSGLLHDMDAVAAAYHCELLLRSDSLHMLHAEVGMDNSRCC